MCRPVLPGTHFLSHRLGAHLVFVCVCAWQYFFEELAKENDNLKRLLLINHDFTASIEDRIKEIEKQE